jgi:hypothetical protein
MLADFAELISRFDRIENPNVVYAILRSHREFQQLATFTLLGGLREIQKRMLARAANRNWFSACSLALFHADANTLNRILGRPQDGRSAGITGLEPSS